MKGLRGRFKLRCPAILSIAGRDDNQAEHLSELSGDDRPVGGPHPHAGFETGDPKKAAQAIVRLTQEQKLPLRLLLGSDAYKGAEKNDLARLEEARAWKELSLSTDF